MTPVTWPIERLCRPKCEVKLHNEKLIKTWFFTFSYNNTFPLWTTKLIWLRAYHLLDAMKHDVMELVLLIYSQKIDSLFLSAKCGDTAIYCIEGSNTSFSREENFAKSEFEIFSREDIFANILFTRKYLSAKISSRENIFWRKYPLAKISSRENILPRKSFACLTIVMTVVYHKCLKISAYHLWKAEQNE